MNCKPGDLAVVVRGDGSIPIGAIVGCIRCFPFATLVVGSRDVWSRNVWEVSLRGTPVQMADGCDGYGIEDADLRPIRPTDGEDETLQWAGKPNEVTA